MSSKYQFYAAVAERAAKDVINTRGNWMNFLDAAARSNYIFDNYYAAAFWEFEPPSERKYSVLSLRKEIRDA